MADRRSNSAKAKSVLMSIASPELQDSALKLRMEVDKLALLLDQVKKQSDRVQEVADAMGYRILPDPGFQALLGADVARFGLAKGS